MLLLNNRLRELFAQPNSVYARPAVRRVILGLAFFTLFMILLSADFVSDKVSLEVGQVSDHDVVATRTVSYIDANKTKKLEAEVLASVANVYDLDIATLTKAEENMGAIFRAAKAVALDRNLTSAAERIDRLQKTLPVPLASTVLDGLANLNEPALSKAEEYTRNLLRKYFQRGIRDDELDLARKHIVVEAEEMGLSSHAEAVVAGIAQALLQPNYILNVRETDKRKQAALASIEPVRETIKKGQILVRKGDVVSPAQIAVMEELGLHKGHVSEIRIFGLAIYLLLIMGVVLGYLYKFVRPVYDNDLQLVLLGLIILVSLLLGKVAHYYSDFAAPVAAGALLAAILIDTRVGLFIGCALAMLFGIIADNELRPVAAVLVGSLTGVYSVSKMAHGYTLTRTGLWMGAVNFLVISSTGFLEQVGNTQVIIQGALGVFSGIAAAVITIGFLPYLENTFNITTSLKLLDLAKPNHPLMQRLLLDAPGTYHHSILVGNLAETAADVVGADPVTVRVGAYYHDIGKIKRPYFFIENQVGGENPHDKIAPSLSTLIVTSHIKDGTDIAREFKLPQAIVDIIQQHHGTTLVSYFYKRATENEHSECIIEADFRYEGPRPQSKEAALVMLADACEAAVRSLSKPNLNRIEATVRKVIRERLHDGQLDDCNLTLKDLDTIGSVFIRVLSGMFHTRVEYPDAIKDLERRKTKNGSGNKQCAGKDDGNAGTGTNGDGCVRKDC
ncbi:MAG: HDIG domain-containing protein [Negativicutes bacterium]|nr:HDIG domain-containing protein [Negativicutes bacterium]